MSGWVLLHRDIQDSIFWDKEPFTRAQAWIDILLTVNWEEKEVVIGNRVYVCKRGQSYNSVESWGKRWKWNRAKVRAYHQLLQKLAMIEIKSNHQTTILTVCNYERYQVPTTTKKPSHSQHIDHQKTTRTTTTKRIKEVKEENNIIQAFPRTEILEEKVSPTLKKLEAKILPIEKEKNSAKKEKSFDDVVWPFSSPDFMQAWDIWTSYRKERGLSKYQPIGLQAAFQDLAKQANGNETEAIAIIKFSISKGWQGLFADKTNHNNGQRAKYDINKVTDYIASRVGKVGNSN